MPSTRFGTPWGLPSELLVPGAKYRDSLYGQFDLTRLERLILNTGRMQHLRRVRQLATANLVYGTATHSRLEHAVGTLAVAQQLLEAVTGSGYRMHGVPTLFDTWRAQDGFERRLAEATVLARLGALLHDLLHVSFGHKIEDVYGLLPSHDAGEARLEIVWTRLVEELERAPELARMAPDQRAKLQTLIDGELFENLRVLILPEQEPRRPLVYPWVNALVGDTFCADLLDYVARDHDETGLPYAHDEHLLNALVVTDRESDYPERLAIATSENGRMRQEVLLSMRNLLAARERIHLTVIHHHTTIAAAAMVAKMVEGWIEVERHRCGDVETARRAVEREMLDLGDDEVLQHVKRLPQWYAREDFPEDVARQLDAVSNLAGAVLDRSLWKRRGSCADRAASAPLRRRFATSEARSALEAEVGRKTGIDANRFVLWIPPTEMWGKRLEEVLFLQGGRVVRAPETEWGVQLGQVAKAHRAAWAAHLIVDPFLTEREIGRLLRALENATQAHWVLDGH